MSVPAHGYSLRPRGNSHSSKSQQPSTNSLTKRKEASPSDENNAHDKLEEVHELCEVKISGKHEFNDNSTPVETITKAKKEHHHESPGFRYAPGSWGYITSKGGRKENQDFYVVPPDELVDMTNPNTALLFGVFDGHGIKGLEAARESARWIHAHFTASNSRPAAGGKTQEWVDLALHEAFRQAQASLLQMEAKSKHVLDYGTTACVAVVRPSLHDMTIAWAGDARAAVVRWETVVSTPRLVDSDEVSSSGSNLGEKLGLILAQSHDPTNITITTNAANTTANTTNTTNTTTNTTTTTTNSSGSNSFAHNLTRANTRIIEQDEEGGKGYICSPYLNSDSPVPGSPASSTTTLDDFAGVQPTLLLVELTTDHVPQREDERARVLQQGGVIRRVGGVVRVVAGGNFTEEQLKQQRLALNITRSLGHAILSQYGISSEPDVLRTTIQHDDILIIASDGLWNELSSSEISSIALDCKMAGFSPQKFCNMLLRRCEVISKLKGVLSDNITIVVYHHT